MVMHSFHATTYQRTAPPSRTAANDAQGKGGMTCYEYGILYSKKCKKCESGFVCVRLFLVVCLINHLVCRLVNVCC